MNLEIVLLGFLNDEPMTGYDLSKKMDVSVGFFWHATHPQIYTSLKKLVSKDFIRFDHQIPEFGPAKKIYSLTKKGKDYLLNSLVNEVGSAEIKFPLLVSMFHGSELGKEHWISVLETQIHEQESKLQVFVNIRNSIPEFNMNQDLFFLLKLCTVEFGIGYQKQFIDWLNSTLKILKS